MDVEVLSRAQQEGRFSARWGWRGDSGLNPYLLPDQKTVLSSESATECSSFTPLGRRSGLFVGDEMMRRDADHGLDVISLPSSQAPSALTIDHQARMKIQNPFHDPRA